jgi:glycosyltransferase involved in cell wall biosynthesis
VALGKFVFMFFPDYQHVGWPEILSLIAFGGFVLIIINYIVNVAPVSFFKSARLSSAEMPVPVSIIICAKNEEENLTEFLPRVLSQDYPDFEVVVVNDCSWDNTERVVDEFAKIFPNLRKATIKEDPYYKHGKKFAMLVGIKAATHNHLLFTDADCYPSSEQWLREMATGFTAEKELVLGYGAYERKSGFLNRLIRYDAYMIAVQFLSAAIRKKPYMGVGRNLAYTRSLFFREKGFSTHYHINSGDDDLFVNQVANGGNTNVCISDKAITYSIAKTSFREWSIQKARHFTTSPLYNSVSKSRLAFNYFSQYFFYLSLIPLPFSMKTVLIIPALLLLKIIAQLLSLGKGVKKLNERDLLTVSWVYELILLFIYPIFHVTKFFYKQNRWTN